MTQWKEGWSKQRKFVDRVATKAAGLWFGRPAGLWSDWSGKVLSLSLFRSKRLAIRSRSDDWRAGIV